MSELNRRGFLEVAGVGLAALFVEPPIRKLGIQPEAFGVEASVNKVTFRQDSIMEVNGEPIFPLGLFYLPGPESPKSWEKMEKAGLNTICQEWINKETLEEAKKNQIYTIAYLPYAFPEVEKNIIDPNILEQLRASKSFLGYYVCDEPDYVLDRDLRTSCSRELGRLDPDHPGMVVFPETSDISDTGPIDLEQYKAKYPYSTADLKGLPNIASHDYFEAWYIKSSGVGIVSLDYYDNLSGSGLDINKIVTVGDVTGKYVEKLRTGVFGPKAKMIAVTLSAHSEVPLTYQIMLFQAISVIAHGATGVYWWDWPQKGYSTHWEKLKLINARLSGAKEGLTNRELFLGNNESGSVAYKVTVGKDLRHCIFSASNLKTPRPSPMEKVAVFTPNTVYQVLGEGRVVRTDRDGNLEDNFSPLATHIYVEE